MQVTETEAREWAIKKLEMELEGFKSLQNSPIEHCGEYENDMIPVECSLEAFKSSDPDKAELREAFRQSIKIAKSSIENWEHIIKTGRRKELHDRLSDSIRYVKLVRERLESMLKDEMAIMEVTEDQARQWAIQDLKRKIEGEEETYSYHIYSDSIDKAQLHAFLSAWVSPAPEEDDFDKAVYHSYREASYNAHASDRQLTAAHRSKEEVDKSKLKPVYDFMLYMRLMAERLDSMRKNVY